MTFCVMEFLLLEGSLSQNEITPKLIVFCVDGVSIFQGTKLRSQCKFNNHCVSHLELICSCIFFLHFPWCIKWKLCFKFCANIFAKISNATKLVNIMEIKWIMILKNVKTIFMLSPTKMVMVEYQAPLMKMGMEMDTNFQVTTNFDHLVNLDVLLSLACIFLSYETFHSLIKFFQGNVSFICAFVNAIKICQTQLYSLFVNLGTKFQVKMFH